jgi:serine/threonine protein kinase/WD40 repeat protein
VKEDLQNSVIVGGPVDAALAEYMLRRERGESVDLSQLIAAYPGCEDELRKFIAQERNVHRAFGNGSPVTSPTHELAGRTLGDFRLRRIIGRGGMGVVWEAEQLSLHRKVAVKLLPGAMCSDPRHRTRFQNEARILAQLEHPNIVNVIAVGEEADTYYFAMQYIEGITADDLIRLWSKKSLLQNAAIIWEGEAPAEPLAHSDEAQRELRPPEEYDSPGQIPPWASCTDRRERYRLCARIAYEIASGLAHAHACGVLHRDVKPSNILLDKNGGARLTDFGLARMYGDATLTATGTILGTLRYASPEQLSGTHNIVDERSDVYSLGASLWELVTGKRLFAAENRNSVITQVLKVDAPRASASAAGLPRDLETIITRAMAKEPADRYASAQVFADDLQRFLEGRPIQAKPISLGERAFHWANRNRALATASVGSLVVLAVVAILASGLVLRANSRTAEALAESREKESEARDHAAAAEANARKTRELYYAADMVLAGAAWRKREYSHMSEILKRYSKPKDSSDALPVEDLRGFEWYFLDRQIPAPPELLFQNDQSQYVIELTAVGNQFFTAGKDGIVRWHDAKSGKVVRSLDTQQGEVNCVSHNPSRTLFATAGDDGTAKVWNAENLTLRQTITANDDLCLYAKFVNDQSVITGGDSEVRRLYDVSTGQLIREYVPSTPKLPEGCVGSSVEAHVSKTGKRFWTTEQWSGDFPHHGLYEWEVDSGKSRRVSDDANIRTVLMDRSERFLFLNMVDGQIRVLDTDSGFEKQSFRLEHQSRAIAISPDERWFVAGDDKGQIYVWRLDLSNPSQVIATEPMEKFSIQKAAVSAVVFSPNGASLISAGRDGSVRRASMNLQGPFHEVTDLRNHSPLTHSGTDNVAVFAPLAVPFIEPKTGQLNKRHSFFLYPAAKSISDETIVGARVSGYIGIWKVATGELIHSFRCGPNKPTPADIALDGSLLVVWHEQNGQRSDLIDPRSGTSKKFFDLGNPPQWARFCIDDGLVAWLPGTGQLVCWNVNDKTVRWQTKPLEIRSPAARMSLDRKSMMTIDGHDIALVDCATGKIHYRTRCEQAVNTLAFLSNDRSFVVDGRGGRLSLWHTGTGQCLFEIANLGTSTSSIQSFDSGFLAEVPVDDGSKGRVLYEF